MNLRLFVEQALEEDVGREDITSVSIIPPDVQGEARIFAKSSLIVCGHHAASLVFEHLGCTYHPQVEEGMPCKYGENIALVRGPYRNLLTAERLALNFLMKLCGIATHTRNTVQGVQKDVRVVDTRKTTPMFRALERDAVRVGGGHNHRFALYDGILIKENHIMIAGSVDEAIKRAKRYAHHLLKIEIEVESLKQLEEAIIAGADVVMLDNMTDEQLKEAVLINNGRVLLEASGNMNRERILAIQDIGVHIVSMGGLIHQATWSDISMRLTL